MHDQSLSLSNCLTNWPTPLAMDGHSLNYILSTMTDATHIKQRLNTLGAYFIQQFLNIDYTKPLAWKLLPHSTGIIPRGREPGWYQVLTNKILTNIPNASNTNMSYPNPYTLQ